MIDRLDHAAKAAGQILGLEHGIPSGQQQFSKLEVFFQRGQGDHTHVKMPSRSVGPKDEHVLMASLEF